MRVFVADDRPMVADALALYIRAVFCDAEISIEPKLEALVERGREAPAARLVFIGYDLLARAGLDILDRLFDVFPGIPLVLIVDSAEPSHLLPALERGVAGVVTTRMSRAGISRALEMFLAGESYVPSQILVSRGLREARAPFAHAGQVKTGRDLTTRQRQVLALLADGKTNREIAERLGTTQANAADHVKRLLKKMNAANRAEAAVKAVRLGLSGPD